jgi:hypothetical protein
MPERYWSSGVHCTIDIDKEGLFLHRESWRAIAGTTLIAQFVWPHAFGRTPIAQVQPSVRLFHSVLHVRIRARHSSAMIAMGRVCGRRINFSGVARELACSPRV